MNNYKTVGEVAGYEIVESQEGERFIRRDEDIFHVPEKIFEVSEEFSEKLGSALAKSSHLYEDEGYELNLMLMYLLSDSDSRNELRRLIDEINKKEV